MNIIPLHCNFVLLYSTVGYELNATKRALVRIIDPINPELLDERKSHWQIIDAEGNNVMEGSLSRQVETYGIQLWEIDFSNLKKDGEYTLHVELENTESNKIATLSSLPFEVTGYIHFKRTFLGVSVRNAEIRKAPPEEGGGYYDCDSKMGEAYSHGVFLAGLAVAYQKRHQQLDSQDVSSLIAAIDRCVDYLMLLHDGATGEIRHEHPSRPNQLANLGDDNTLCGLYGLVTYCHLFKEINPDKTKKVFQAVLKSIEYLESKNYLSPEFQTIIFYRLYKYSGDKTYKDKTISAVNHIFSSFSWPDSVSAFSFEGIYYAIKEFNDVPDRNRWIQETRKIGEKYFKNIINQNAFRILPLPKSNTINWQRGLPPEISWEEFGSGCTWWGIYRFAFLATDAIMLAELTGDHSYEKIATGSLGWITGLHPGIPGKLTANPKSQELLASAAFIANVDARHAALWSEEAKAVPPHVDIVWYNMNHDKWKPENNPWISLMNGMMPCNGYWVYIDDWRTAETFIKHDGAYLQAICFYEDYLNRGEKTLDHIQVKKTR